MYVWLSGCSGHGIRGERTLVSVMQERRVRAAVMVVEQYMIALM